MMMTGDELRCRRLALGLNQDALAEVLGAKQVKISRWETGSVDVPEWVDREISELEVRQDQLVASYVPAGTARVYSSEDACWAAEPALDGVPLVVQFVAAARARRQLGGRIAPAYRREEHVREVEHLLAQARACADPGATTALLEQGNAIMRAHGIEKADLDNDAVTAEKEKILADRVRRHGTVFPPRIFPG